MSDEGLRVLWEDERAVAAAMGRVFISVWTGKPTAAALRSLQAAQATWLSTFDQPFCAISIIETTVGMRMDAEAKQAAADVRAGNRDRIIGSGVVVEQAGFWAAIVRSAIGGMEFLNRTRVRSETFKSVSAACQWAARAVEEESPDFPERLAADIADLRTRRDSPPAAASG